MSQVDARLPGEPREGLKILVVDDDPAMVGALGAVLGRAGHRIVAAYDGAEALRRFSADQIDVVLLDLAMPGLDGAEVCRLIRQESDVPIIVVSGERDRTAPVQLLNLGADDYVRKGAPSAELLARIAAVVRRRGGGRRATDARAAAGWEVDGRRHEIRWQGRAVPATAIEFRLLAALVERPDEVVSHSTLLRAGWPGVDDPDPLWLKPHLARLREKLAALNAPLPIAVRAVGYRLEGLRA